ncbi:DUF3817 domain-containing protein [Pseudomonas sp. TH34]|uniref:DUF3817 domain-containing protein n=1 Tax=Pseudomonas sp. TH34 TaxID=2796399 RepID=UPI001F5B2333|nr:DUF3817 domain-containing protein [Pseudomonas sp. TH34]
MMNNSTSRTFGILRQLRYAALLEGTTLIVLLGVAVPLKHLIDYPVAVKIMGPLHGLAFLLYCWLVINAATSERWRGAELFCALGSALIPLGGFFAARHFRHQQNAARSQYSSAENDAP